MYRPFTIGRHNESLKKFQMLFNNSEPYDIVMCEWADISKLNDGVIIYRDQQIIFDWEWRDDWDASPDRCEFHYPTLGQFERKFKQETEIELTIQCDRNERCFAVAWHVDFGPPKIVERKTNYKWRERGKMRETDKFRVYNYSQISEFKRALKRAFEHNIRNYKCFEVEEHER
jgi:hypothetical protein